MIDSATGTAMAGLHEDGPLPNNGFSSPLSSPPSSMPSTPSSYEPSLLVSLNYNPLLQDPLSFTFYLPSAPYPTLMLRLFVLTLSQQTDVDSVNTQDRKRKRAATETLNTTPGLDVSSREDLTKQDNADSSTVSALNSVSNSNNPAYKRRRAATKTTNTTSGSGISPEDLTSEDEAGHSSVSALKSVSNSSNSARRSKRASSKKTTTTSGSAIFSLEDLTSKHDDRSTDMLAPNSPSTSQKKGKLSTATEEKEDTTIKKTTKPSKYYINDAQKDKPEPYGEPDIWCDKRQGLCEALPYYRAYQSGPYTKDNLVHGLMVNNEVGERDWFDDQIMITRV
jgi:hypothetical protein